MLEDEIRRHRRRKRAAIIAAVTAAALVCAALAAWFTIKLTDITVTGNDNLTESQVIREVFPEEKDRRTLQAWYFLDTERSLPMLESWSVEITGMHSAEITVTEKEPIGRISFADSYLYFDDEGYELRSGDGTDGVPQLFGFSFVHPVKYSKLTAAENEEYFEDALALLKLLNEYGLSPVSVTCDPTVRMSYSMDMGSISVVIGTSDYLEEKVSALYDMQDELTGLIGTLHLETCDGTGTNSYYFVRE